MSWDQIAMNILTSYYTLFSVAAVAIALITWAIIDFYASVERSTWKARGKIRIVDLDNSVMKFVRPIYDRKRMIYYLRYKISTFTTKEIPVTEDLIKYDTLYIYKDKIHTHQVDSDHVKLTASDLKKLLKIKILSEIINPSLTLQIAFVILGIGVGFGIGYVVKDFFTTDLIMRALAPQHQNANITTTTSTELKWVVRPPTAGAGGG
jgi:hypothetical protein